jgi:glucose/arabinose dehydrogenase
LFKLKFALLTLALFTLASLHLPFTSKAQTRPVTVAPGFEFNQFADAGNVSEFTGTGQAGAGAGATVMAFDARGRLFVGTGHGKILILLDTNEDGRCDTVKTFASGISIPLGLEFRSNGDLYVASNLLAGAGRILRLRDTNGDDVADEQVTIVDGLPSEGDHQTNKLRFGPDGLLYIEQGSATDKGTPSPGHPEEKPLNGTVLRVNVDAANPQSTLEVFATGMRNPFGMAFHPDNGELFATDVGSGELCQFTPCPEDTAPPEEINWVVQGGNYGFPNCEGTPDSRPACQGVRPPIQQFTRHLTPTSLEFYTGPQANENANNLLVTIYKRLFGEGGDLRRLKIEGDKMSGFRVTQNEMIAEFGLIDPGDGPVDTRIDPISGDIYVARFDPVSHANPNEHHHIIYRIHRQGSDSQAFIGNLQPATLAVNSGATTIRVTGRRLRSGASLFADGVQLTTRQDANGDWAADLPASFTTSQRTITIQAQNSDGTRTNMLSLMVKGSTPPPPPPDKVPQITSFFAYFKKRANVQNPLVAGTKAKKLGLVVTGTDFDATAQLLINGEAVELISASDTELIGKFTKAMVRTPGDLNIQIRNSTGKVSNVVKLTVVSQ